MEMKMKMEAVMFCLLSLVVFVVMVSAVETDTQTVETNSGSLDPIWQERAVEAKKAAQESFNPNPTQVTNEVNGDVHKTAKQSNARKHESDQVNDHVHKSVTQKESHNLDSENRGKLDPVWQERAVEAKKAANEAYNPNPSEILDQFNGNVHKSVKQTKSQKLDSDNRGKLDPVWQARAIEAKKAAQEAYNPNPSEVMDQVNGHVHKATEGQNSTRRDLHKYKGPCVASNPIDQCWRCDKNWAKNRMKLADCALGFGRHTTGGKGGEIYVVTDPSDNDLVNPKPGTLRHAVIQPEPLWIIFAHHMVIRLSEELIMTSNKTIDARGAQVHIAHGAGITLQFVQNIIIHNLRIHDVKAGNGGLIRSSVDHFGYRTQSDGDGISIFGSTNIWIDHISMSNCQDGLIDIVQCSTAITISNSHFTRHNDVMLFGASDSYSDDRKMQITVAFNHFGQGLVQRMPRCRWGFFHIVNNDYTHWLMYAIGGSKNPTILSQGNRFIAPPNRNAKEVTKRDYASESEWKNWLWRSEGDLMMNGAFFTPSGNPKQNLDFPDLIGPKPGTYANWITRFSGSLNCFEKKPC